MKFFLADTSKAQRSSCQFVDKRTVATLLPIDLTNRFQVAMRLFSNRSQRTSKCGKNIGDTLGHRLVCHSFVTTFWRHLCSITKQTQGNMEPICCPIYLTSSVIYYWIDARQHGTNLLYIRKQTTTDFYFKIFQHYSTLLRAPLRQSKTNFVFDLISLDYQQRLFEYFFRFIF